MKSSNMYIYFKTLAFSSLFDTSGVLLARLMGPFGGLPSVPDEHPTVSGALVVFVFVFGDA